MDRTPSAGAPMGDSAQIKRSNMFTAAATPSGYRLSLRRFPDPLGFRGRLLEWLFSPSYLTSISCWHTPQLADTGGHSARFSAHAVRSPLRRVPLILIDERDFNVR